VAITRAMEELVICTIYGKYNRRNALPSRFLVEMGLTIEQTVNGEDVNWKPSVKTVVLDDKDVIPTGLKSAGSNPLLTDGLTNEERLGAVHAGFGQGVALNNDSEDNDDG